MTLPKTYAAYSTWIYEYDGTPFTSSINLNDDCPYIQPGFCIFDRVNIALVVADERLDIGANTTITWSGIYEYDGPLFNGSITLPPLPKPIEYHGERHEHEAL